DTPIAAGGQIADGADDVELAGGDAVMQSLCAGDTNDGVACQLDRSGPDDRAAQDSEGAGVGLGGGQPDLVHAAAVSSDRHGVQCRVDGQVANLNLRQAVAQQLPVAVAGRPVSAAIGADEEIVAARINDELPRREVQTGGARAGDVRPASPGVSGSE